MKSSQFHCPIWLALFSVSTALSFGPLFHSRPDCSWQESNSSTFPPTSEAQKFRAQAVTSIWEFQYGESDTKMGGDLGVRPDTGTVQKPGYRGHFPFLVLENPSGSSLASKAEPRATQRFWEPLFK